MDHDSFPAAGHGSHVHRRAPWCCWTATQIYRGKILGNKGHGIDAMRRHELPVPPAFCITTDVGMRYLAEPRTTIDAIWDAVLDRMSWLEGGHARTFSGPAPCWSACAREATQSMPGMMDTILDLGINDAVEQALAAASTRITPATPGGGSPACYQRIVGHRDRLGAR